MVIIGVKFCPDTAIVNKKNSWGEFKDYWISCLLVTLGTQRGTFLKQKTPAIFLKGS